MITGHENGTYHGEFTLRVGPFAAVHRGTVRIDEAAEARTSSASSSAASSERRLRRDDRQHARGDRGRDPRRRRRRADGRGALAVFVGSGVIEDVANRLLRDFATCLAGRLNAPPTPTGADVTAGQAAPEELLAAAPPPDPEGDGRMSDCGICGGDVPPLIGDVLTGTGLTLAQAAARLDGGEEVPALTPVQRRIVEDYAARL